MSMVEPLDGLDDLGLLNILDFQLDKEDEEGIGDWDASKSQFLGPIPSDLIMGPPVIPRGAIKTQPPRFMPGTVTSQQQFNYVQEASSSHIRRHSKYAEFQEPGIFQMQSPVSVLESNGSSSSGKRLPIRPNIVIPRRTRSKRVRPSDPNRWLDVLAASTFKKTSSAMNYMGRRKRLSPTETVKVYKEVPDAASPYPGDVKKCSHCQITRTPQWREGPMGPKTLCNACGVRYRSGRLYPEYRPAGSPTFVPSLHSNCHRKVVELRNKAERQPQPQPQVTRVERPAASPTFGPSLHSDSQRNYIELPNQAERQPQVTIVERPAASPTFVPPLHSDSQRKVTRVERPAASPTFVPSLHSDSQRKLIELPNQAERQPQVTIVERRAASPMFVPPPLHSDSQRKVIEMRNKAERQPQVTRVERPAASPTFVPSLHSDSQRKVIELRNKAEKQPQPQVTRVERPAVSPTFVPSLQSDSQRRLSPTETVKVYKEVPDVASPYPGDVKKCSHCQITRTPQWREGPMGRKTLCNACGLRYCSGRLYPEYRPAVSPTFVPSLYTNSHRKVMELRNKAERQPQPQPQVTKVERPAVSPTSVPSLHSDSQRKVTELWNKAESQPQPQVTRVEILRIETVPAMSP